MYFLLFAGYVKDSLVEGKIRRRPRFTLKLSGNLFSPLVNWISVNCGFPYCPEYYYAFVPDFKLLAGSVVFFPFDGSKSA
jgi:hypothetical protein